MICKKCGMDNGDGWRFCNHCGAKAEDTSIKTTGNKVIFCVNCSSALDFGSKFCVKCGAKTQEAQKNAKYCVNCGALLEDGMKFCVKCGTKTEQPLNDDKIHEIQPAEKTEASEILHEDEIKEEPIIPVETLIPADADAEVETEAEVVAEVEINNEDNACEAVFEPVIIMEVEECILNREQKHAFVNGIIVCDGISKNESVSILSDDGSKTEAQIESIIDGDAESFTDYAKKGDSVYLTIVMETFTGVEKGYKVLKAENTEENNHIQKKNLTSAAQDSVAKPDSVIELSSKTQDFARSKGFAAPVSFGEKEDKQTDAGSLPKKAAKESEKENPLTMFENDAITEQIVPSVSVIQKEERDETDGNELCAVERVSRFKGTPKLGTEDSNGSLRFCNDGIYYHIANRTSVLGEAIEMNFGLIGILGVEAIRNRRKKSEVEKYVYNNISEYYRDKYLSRVLRLVLKFKDGKTISFLYNGESMENNEKCLSESIRILDKYVKH